MITWLLMVALALAGTLGTVLWLRRVRVTRIGRLRMKLFLLKFPREHREGKELVSEIAVSEALFAAAADMEGPVVFEVAVPHIGETIRFYAAVPAKMGDIFARRVRALWNDALVEEADDYSVFHDESAVVGGYARLAELYVPLQTFAETKTDTFAAIIGGFSEVDAVGEGAALQIVIKKAPQNVRKSFAQALVNVRGGKKPEVPKKGFVGDVVETLSGMKASGRAEKEPEINEDLARALELKLKKPLLSVNVRILVSAPSPSEAETLFEGIASGFAQFEAPQRNRFDVVKARGVKAIARKFVFREFDMGSATTLNTEELASICHMPTAFTETPRVEVVRARQLPPPPELPADGTLLGETVYRGERKKVYLPDEDRRRHLYVIGQTGTGKSTLLVNAILSDVMRGKGVAVIDPHGDLVEHVAGFIPEERRRDVIFFDPGALDRPLGMNMLEYRKEHPEEKTFIVNEMMSIFNKLYDLKTTGGPMFEQYMRNALLLLMESAAEEGGEPATLMEVPRVFSDAEYRKRLLARIKNPTVIDFWEKEAIKAGGEAALQNIAPYVTSKFNNFIANDYMRLIIGQPRSAFRARQVMDEGKILLVNLSKGKIGEANAGLLGMIIVGKLLFAALSRADMPESERRDFSVFIDEFQNVTTESVAAILSEARKYRLGLTIAHQFIGQLSEPIRKAVFGNVGSMISFRIGAEDAEVLIKQFEPFLAVEDLVNIDNFSAYVKLLLRGQTTDPFNIRTFPMPQTDAGVAAELLRASQEAYGAPRVEVEEEIVNRLRR